MSALPSYFSDFLANIRLQADDIADLKRGHTTLRQQLLADPDLGGKIVGTFLQGSYRRATAVKPENGKRSDVDVVVVTTIDKGEYTPEQTLAAFKPFMDRHYKGKYEVQGRSIGIELSYVDLDCVITAAPSVSEQGVLKSSVVMSEETIEDATDDWRVMFSTKATPQWKVDPLWIPDRDVQCWTATHPLEQIRWTQEKNQRCKTHYINVVKALKWWRRLKYTTPKYPKGYPVEHLIGQCCPDNIDSVAAGVALTLEAIVANYRWQVAAGRVPVLPDHGVPEHDVFKRITAADFALFYEQVSEAAVIARQAYDETDLATSVGLWKKLFGDDFPDAPDDKGEFSDRQQLTIISRERFS
jgi:hypothetical protein